MATDLSASASRGYARAVDRVCSAVDSMCGDPEAMSLGSADLTKLLARWERTLPADYEAGSKQPALLFCAVRLLIVRRGDHPERLVQVGLAEFARGRALAAWGESAELDEFTRIDKVNLVKAAWAAAHALERRIADGWALREAQVSHATVHRAQEILAEWDIQVAQPALRTPGEVRPAETVTELKAKLREANTRVGELQAKLDALTTMTANPYRETIELKKKAARTPKQNRLGLLHDGRSSPSGLVHTQDTDS
ncbi:hypothetical protein ACFXPT_35155 [Streptomyces goshikiensis]|uniref:hypothetical protein n=1 Tax=Streptomyces goshikiensis TaxID=1942 RepID=UPI00368A4F68